MDRLRLKTTWFLAVVILLSSCSFFNEDDFEDPSPFLQYEATASLEASPADELQVQVRVINQHRSSDVVLAHSLCNVTVLLTPEDETIAPASLAQTCADVMVTSTIGASGSKTFTFQMSREDLRENGVQDGTYAVTATIRFAQLARQDLNAGTISLADQS